MRRSTSFRKSFKNSLDCKHKCWKEFSTAEETEKESYLSSLLLEFCQESSLHGLRFIGNSRRHKVERIFWFFAFFVSVGFAVYSISLVWDEYKRTPIVTVFQPTEVTIDRIAFPAVTICNSNIVIKEKADFLTKRLLENDSNASHHELYILDHVCESSRTFSESFNFSLEEGALTQSVRHKLLKEASKYEDSNPDANDKELISTLRNVSQKCSEMILLCVWNDEVANCADLFEGIETDFGYCCVFNMAPADLIRNFRDNPRENKQKISDWKNLNLDADKMVLRRHKSLTQNKKAEAKYPRRQFRPGKSSGLSILLDPNLNSYFCTNTDSTGFMALPHLPLTFPTVSERAAAIQPNSEVFMKVKPEVTMADPSIIQFSLDKRNCYFGKEHQLVNYKYYTTANCADECIADVTYEECQCVRYYMPRNSSQKLCSPKQFPCTERVRKRILQEGFREKCQECLPTCTEINYDISISSIPLRKDVALWRHPNGTDAKWTNKNVTILHVYFDVDSTYPKLRTELHEINQNFLDKYWVLCHMHAASTGGLLGLCLGFSILSFLEIVYYLTIRVCCASKKGRQFLENLDEATASAFWNATTRQSFAKRFHRRNCRVFCVPAGRSSSLRNLYEGHVVSSNSNRQKMCAVSNDLRTILQNQTLP